MAGEQVNKRMGELVKKNMNKERLIKQILAEKSVYRNYIKHQSVYLLIIKNNLIKNISTKIFTVATKIQLYDIYCCDAWYIFMFDKETRVKDFFINI